MKHESEIGNTRVTSFKVRLSYLPNAVLAAIVLLIGVKLIDYRGLAEIRA